MLFFNTNRPNQYVSLRRFVSPGDIKTLLEKKYGGETFSLDQFLLIFDTVTQHTWLVSSDKSFLCVVDRRKEDRPRVLWRMLKDDITDNGDLAIEINAEETADGSGIVKIGSQGFRKFSTSLFSAEELIQQIVKLLPYKASNHVAEVDRS